MGNALTWATRRARQVPSAEAFAAAGLPLGSSLSSTASGVGDVQIGAMSLVLKLGKLTKATPCYRGISQRTLPRVLSQSRMPPIPVCTRLLTSSIDARFAFYALVTTTISSA